MDQKKSQRGGAVKKAPPGYYTAKEAMERLVMNPSTFHYHVRTGKIKKHVPPARVEGFYAKKEIDRLATKLEIFLQMLEEEEKTTEVRVARPEDVPGIVAVLTSMSWRTTSVEQRQSWYKVNPLVDFVILRQGEVIGYINSVPYKRQAMKDIIAHRRRAWDMFPSDIQVYHANHHYDLYVGIAVRQDIPHPKWFSAHLITGYLELLQDLATRGILIRRMYAVSAEPRGQKLCEKLGFIEMETQPDYVFPDWKRYELDLGTSDSSFAKQYREALPH